jgi:hypothetical protein
VASKGNSSSQRQAQRQRQCQAPLAPRPSSVTAFLWRGQDHEVWAGKSHNSQCCDAPIPTHTLHQMQSHEASAGKDAPHQHRCTCIPNSAGAQAQECEVRAGGEGNSQRNCLSIGEVVAVQQAQLLEVATREGMFPATAMTSTSPMLSQAQFRTVRLEKWVWRAGVLWSTHC